MKFFEVAVPNAPPDTRRLRRLVMTLVGLIISWVLPKFIFILTGIRIQKYGIDVISVLLILCYVLLLVFWLITTRKSALRIWKRYRWRSFILWAVYLKKIVVGAKRRVLRKKQKPPDDRNEPPQQC